MFRSFCLMGSFCFLLLTAGVLTAEQSANDEQKPAASSQTLSVRIEPGKAAAPVPNSAMSVMDLETMDIVHEKWKHLVKTMNRPHREDPMPLQSVTPKDVKPWAAPTVAGSTLTFGNPIQLETNETPSTAQPGSSATVNEPSVAAVGDYVFYTANWYAAASTDGGATWAYVNPYTGPFPEPDGQNFCCDQQAHYDPSSNSVFWLQQLIPATDTDNGTQRVNVDQGANGTWDCFYDLNPQDAGFQAASLPDYPDFSISNGHLFVTSNIFRSSLSGFLGSFIGRLPLADITTCAATTVNYYTETTFGSFRTTQGAGDTMYFADHESSSSIRVWSWPDAGAAPTFVSRSINPFLDGTRSCTGPGGQNWCGSIDSRIYGAALAGDRAAFIWTAQQNVAGGFPFPYSQGVILDTANNMAVIEQPLIWSNDAAWTYPSLAANSEGGFGGTVLWGGGTHFPQCSVFLADADNGDSFNPLEHQVAISGTSDPSVNRSGDYLATRVYSPNDKVYAGTCFSFFTSNAATSKYVLFGREENFQTGAIFSDGFESGDTGMWSSASP